MRQKPFVRLVLFLLLLGQILATRVRADDSAKGIESVEVCAEVEALRAELEQLRFEMGCPLITQIPFRVEGAAPREVYFQAVTLHRKADRLSFEHLRQRGSELPKAGSSVNTADVLIVIRAARSKVAQVRKQLGLGATSEPTPASDISDSDALERIVLANRQLNELLDHEFSPSDVFQQVTTGLSYSAALLSRFPQADRLSDEPPWERGKRPADVFDQLLNCFDCIRRIADSSGIEMLAITSVSSQIADLRPSDVYDVASLIVAELAFLHSQLPEPPSVREVHYPGRKFPSHVFQRAAMLNAQLHEIERHIVSNSKWLSNDLPITHDP